MARTCRNPLLWLACGLTSAGAAVSPSTAAAPALSPLGSAPIVVDAASSEADLAKGTGVFTDITITQGGMRLSADHARGSYPVDFKNSHWTFQGHVRIDDADHHGNLRAEEAVVDFRNGLIERATVTGKPAEFEQQRADTQQVARGHAAEIAYDMINGSVRLSQDAWLSDGRNEISGPLLVYDIRAQHIQAAAAPGTEQRVHIVITPQGTSTKTAPVRPQPDAP
jgi:lipopolysaccharide transport protein LptA